MIGFGIGLCKAANGRPKHAVATTSKRFIPNSALDVQSNLLKSETAFRGLFSVCLLTDS